MRTHLVRVFSAAVLSGALATLGCVGTSESGNTTSTGAAGLATVGPVGLAGAGGIRGVAGTTGATGSGGSASASDMASARGAAGSRGSAAASGAAGMRGSAAASGALAGTRGSASASGASGTTGSAGAGGAAGASGAAGVSGLGGSSSSTRWVPSKATTFFWDLSGAPPDNTKNVGAYDIDGWDNTSAEVAALHARGLRVVCYMDAGTYEPGRPDSSTFPTSLKGSGVSGWPGELWLDVRPAGPNYATLQGIMRARLQVCHDKGFDAVEPDNMDSYQNKPGFATTAADQLAYNEWIATTVHALGLAVFQKNDLDQIATLEPFFDGILDEECNKYSECSALAPYTAAGKPVWDAEYTDDGETTAAFCSKDAAAGIVGALFSLNLDGSSFSPCPNDVGVVH